MEFSQKLRQLRAARGLTQEALAAQLYVSRTAVSKWESGRGLPNIESLKAIAGFFGVTVDELLSGEELLSAAETEIRTKQKDCAALFCGILDCLAILLLFLPFFGRTTAYGIESVSLPALHFDASWLKISYLALTVLSVLNGFALIVALHSERSEWEKRGVFAGLALTVLSVMIYVLSRQPYAGAFALCCLAAKGYLLLKRG